MRRILLLSPEPFSACLAGPAIRFGEIANALQRAGHAVTLCAATVAADTPAGDLRPQPAPCGAALRELVKAHEIVITSGATLTPALRRAAGSRPVIHDLIIPAYYESLMNNPVTGAGKAADVQRRHLAVHHRAMRRRLLRQLPLADHFLCGSERQRDMLLGWLAAAGAVAHERGNVLLPPDQLVSIVPHGLPAEPPPAPGDKSIFPGCGAGDTIFLWWGCACDWYDLDTVFAAMAELAARRTDIKLVLGARQVPGQAVVADPLARLSARPEYLALFGKSVIVLDRWIPYAERGRYLAAADAGIYAHLPTLESHFSVRTRFFDYLWAGLPVIISDGDCFGPLVRDGQFGLTVPPGASQAWVRAMEKIADDRQFRAHCRARISARRREFTWDAAIRPLTQALTTLTAGGPTPRAGHAAYAAHLLARAGTTLHTAGGLALARKTARHIRKLLS